MNIAVYLGSRQGDSPEYMSSARRVGVEIAKAGHSIVYGGSKGGLMGELASGALENGGRVVGVLPDVEEIMLQKQAGLTEYIYTIDVAERRSKMISLADAFVVLPGGLGTLDEISEVLSLASLKLVNQPIVFFDARGYFMPLKRLFEHMIASGFSSSEYFEKVLFTSDTAEMLNFINEHELTNN